MDALERKMKDTPVEKALDEIFRGETLRYVRCLNVPFESTGKEPFYDVAVTVKGMPSLERSLAAFVEPEFLVGENSYNAEGYGLQEAKLGVVFATLPPVLHIQLKRFEYDFERDRVVKINDRFEFPEVLDMAPFVMLGNGASASSMAMQKSSNLAAVPPCSDSPKSSLRYRLHAVLVHSGDVGGGHYYAFIRGGASSDDSNSSWGRWLRFDDENVYPVSAKEAIDENFGNSQSVLGTHSGADSSSKMSASVMIKRHTSAYMLVYVLESRWIEMVGGIPRAPDHVLTPSNSSSCEEETVRRHQNQSLASVRLLTDTVLREVGEYSDRGLPLDSALESSTIITKPSSELLGSFAMELEQEYGIPVSCQLFYLIEAHGGAEGAQRKIQPITSLGTSFGELANAFLYLTCKIDGDSDQSSGDDGSNRKNGACPLDDGIEYDVPRSEELLFPQGEGSPKNLERAGQVLLFIKSFDVQDGSLRFQASMVVGKHSAIGNSIRSALEIEDLSDWLLVEEAKIDAGDPLSSCFVDPCVPIGTQLDESSMDGVVLIILNRMDLSSFERQFSTVCLSVLFGEALVNMGVEVPIIENVHFPLSVQLGDLLCKLDFASFPLLIDGAAPDVGDVKLLSQSNEWITLPHQNLHKISVRDVVFMAGYKGILSRRKSGIQITTAVPPSGQEVLFYRQTHREFVCASLGKDTLEMSLNYLVQLRKRVKCSFKDCHDTFSLIDFIPSFLPSEMSSLKLLETVNGMVVRVFGHEDKLDVVGGRSLLYLVDLRHHDGSNHIIRIVHSRPSAGAAIALHVPSQSSSSSSSPSSSSSSKFSLMPSSRTSSFSTARSYFGVPSLFVVHPGESMEATMKRLARTVPGVTEFDVAFGRGSLKIHHIRPLGGQNESSERLIATASPAADPNAAAPVLSAEDSLYEYINLESNRFDKDLDLLAIEHPERSPLPIREIGSFSRFSQTPSVSQPISPASASSWARPGDSMRIN